MNTFVLRGGIAFSEDKNNITTYQKGYLVCIEGTCKGAFHELPSEYKELPVYDYGNMLIVPGMTDLHVHAPQYTFRGIGMDKELLDWLNTYTFPEEAKYADMEYAHKAYQFFSEDLRRSFTTRAVVFGTLHNDATINLMDQLEKIGVISYVGKVNMDRNGGKNLQEVSAEASIDATIQWLNDIQGKYENTKPTKDIIKHAMIHLNTLLPDSKISCGFNKIIFNSKSCNNFNDFNKNYNMNNSSIISDLFFGTYEYKTQCKLCKNITLVFILLVAGGVGPWIFIKMKQNKRRKIFESQLCDALMISCSCLRSGLTFQQAMETIAKDMEAPISTEFARACSEINFGASMDKALSDMVERIKSADLMLAVSAISVQRQTGGNLSQILETISNTIRERIKVKADVNATTSQGRMSGLLIGALPIGLALVLNLINPAYMQPMFESTVGHYLLGACVVLEVLGFIVIRKIVDIKY